MRTSEPFPLVGHSFVPGNFLGVTLVRAEEFFETNVIYLAIFAITRYSRFQKVEHLCLLSAFLSASTSSPALFLPLISLQLYSPANRTISQNQASRLDNVWLFCRENLSASDLGVDHFFRRTFKNPGIGRRVLRVQRQYS